MSLLPDPRRAAPGGGRDKGEGPVTRLQPAGDPGEMQSRIILAFLVSVRIQTVADYALNYVIQKHDLIPHLRTVNMSMILYPICMLMCVNLRPQ
jgi:uncharacterized membrane protein